MSGAATLTPWRLSRPNGWTLVSLVLAALVALPLLVVLFYLLIPGDAAWAHMRDTTLLPYTLNTLALMVLVALLAGSMGVITAWLVAATAFPCRRALAWLLVLPLAAPAYIVAYLYTDLLEFAGPVQSSLRALFNWGPGDYWFPNIRSLPGAALVLSLVLYPYVYLLARAAFAARAATPFEAARTLGLSTYGAFVRVALPCARPAIAGGLALVLMETLADFGVVDYFAIPTFSTGIFRTWFAMGERIAALKLAGVMLLFVMALVLFESWSRKGRTDTGSRVSSTPRRLHLSRPQALLAMLGCGLPVVFGFLLPVVLLLTHTLDSGDSLLGPEFWRFASNSLSVAVMAALVATSLALLLAYARRLSGGGITGNAIRIATLGYALPGTLLAVSLLGPITGLDRSLSQFFADSFGWQGGLVLTGTVALLIYAYVIRFMTVSFNAVSAALDNVSPQMDAAARSLGENRLGVVRRIHLPLIRPGLAAACLLVFVDVMRELPATLILRPFNFETLATRVYRLASDERLTEASTAALVIVLLGVLPAILLSRLGQKGREQG